MLASNHFITEFSNGTKARPFFDSEGRYRMGCSLQAHDLEPADFLWLRTPVLNPLTRLAMVADAGTGRLLVQGFEGTVPVTNVFNLPTVMHAKSYAG